ncbi:unnamed protein product [Cladocopium goreaui]|uniref:Uncharacterized protein n=1 Tax=Cladocopium goreaui TaxID=2562237 RepID=A0A9P1GPA4_9DINO|nr:unnamed protein product [Cladocopium goreaui]
MFIQQAMARRAFTSAVKSAHCLFTGLKAGESNGGVWRFNTSELWQGALDFGRSLSLNAAARSDVNLIQQTSDGFSNQNSCLVTGLGSMDKGLQSAKSVLASNSYRWCSS